MRIFEELQARHQALLAQQAEDANILDKVQRYLKEVRQKSSQVAAPAERAQLRANLRYWSSYVYEQTGTYPSVDLAPADVITRPPARARLPIVPLIIAGMILLLILIFGSSFLVGAITQDSEANTPTVESIVELTEIAGEGPTATASPTATTTPTPGTAGIVVQLNTLQDGDNVSPRTRLSGSYRNLRPGWSIHVLLQPISQGGRLFPLASYAVVQRGMTAGEWSIEADFGAGSILENPEQYNITLAVAVNDAARALLESAVENGFDEVPQEIILFPQVTTVVRP